MAAPTAVAVATVLMLPTATSSALVGRASGMTAHGGSVNPKVQGPVPALVQAPLIMTTLPAVKAMVVAVRTAKAAVKAAAAAAAAVAAVAAAAAGVEVQVHLLEVVAVLPSMATLALSVRAHQVLVQVQLQDERCCLTGKTGKQNCDAHGWI